jgi:Dolichyl-phosphate-mannose-protein mannosyltransferase
MDAVPRSARARTTVIVIALLVLIPKLVIAAGTGGTDDVFSWIAFAEGVGLKGPLAVYELHFVTVYNHPPLVGYFLEVVNALAKVGVPVKFTIRALASIADVASAVLVFELLRTRRSLAIATMSGILVATSPVLFLVSGFHGNTDAIFLMLVLLSAFLLIDKRLGLLGGCALALALGVKLVPVVVLPTLVVYLLRRDRGRLVHASAGFAAVLLITWVPAVLREWGSLTRDVIGYSGVAVRQWGLVQFGYWASNANMITFLIDGRILSVAICALVPALLLWRRPDRVVEALGLCLVGFLVLSPAFGVQYLAWPLAAAFLVDFWLAVVYNILGGLFLYNIYDYWSGGLPWNEAKAVLFTPGQVVFGVVVWASLLVVLGVGSRRLIAGQFGPHAGPELAAQRGRSGEVDGERGAGGSADLVLGDAVG